MTPPEATLRSQATNLLRDAIMSLRWAREEDRAGYAENADDDRHHAALAWLRREELGRAIATLREADEILDVAESMGRAWGEGPEMPDAYNGDMHYAARALYARRKAEGRLTR